MLMPANRNVILWLSLQLCRWLPYLGWIFSLLQPSRSYFPFVHSVLPFVIFLSWLVSGFCWSAPSPGVLSSIGRAHSFQILKSIIFSSHLIRERKPRFPEDLLVLGTLILTDSLLLPPSLPSAPSETKKSGKQSWDSNPWLSDSIPFAILLLVKKDLELWNLFYFI